MSYCVGIYYVASIEKIDSLCVCEILFIYLFIVIFQINNNYYFLSKQNCTNLFCTKIQRICYN